MLVELATHPHEGSTHPAEQRLCRVAEQTLVSPRTMMIDLVPADGAPVPLWAPGSHVAVTLPSGLIRHYSLCGSRDTTDRFTIAVQLNHPGNGSAELHALDPGDRLTVSSPRDRFPLVEANRHLFIAGGIGITPFISMIADLESRSMDYEVHYAVRSTSEASLAQRLPHPDSVNLYPSDEKRRLSLADIIKSAPTGTAVYACGPAPLLDELGTWAFELRRRGVTLHTERFTADSTTESDEPGGTFNVKLARSGAVVEVGAGESILDRARDAGCTVPSSCEEGYCGTCETRVIDGIPDHRDDFLTPEERASGDTMMICVSRAKSADLTLDL